MSRVALQRSIDSDTGPAGFTDRPAVSGGDVDEHLHDRAAAERRLHALLERLERNDPAHEGGERNRAGRAEADRLLPGGASVEPASVEAELTREEAVELHSDPLRVDRDDADRAPYPDALGDGLDGGGVTRDLERHVDAVAVGPFGREPDRIDARPDHLEPEPPQHLDPEGVDLDDGHPRPSMPRHERDQAANRSAAEHEHRAPGLDAGPRHVVRRDDQRLDDGGVA